MAVITWLTQSICQKMFDRNENRKYKKWNDCCRHVAISSKRDQRRRLSRHFCNFKICETRSNRFEFFRFLSRQKLDASIDHINHPFKPQVHTFWPWVGVRFAFISSHTHMGICCCYVLALSYRGPIHLSLNHSHVPSWGAHNSPFLLKRTVMLREPPFGDVQT
jgi:hypothetical protein